jgi:hypothetical protein
MNQLPDDPIEVYLDQLLVHLPGTPRQVRHTLYEIEAHLRDGAVAAEADGLDEHAAAVLAVQRMGPVGGVVDSHGFRFHLTPARRRRAVLGTLFVGTAGGIAVGAAGLTAAVVRMTAGDRAVGIPFPTGAYSQSDCARWLAAYPAARDCVAAMTIDHANDFLLSTAVVGFVGIVCLTLRMVLRRRWNSHAVAAVIPAYSEDAAAAVLALLATVFLVAQGVDSVLVTRGQGTGQWFCLAAAALGVAAICLARARSRTRLSQFTSRRIVR